MMIKLSRRKFLCGVAAIAVAAPVAKVIADEYRKEFILGFDMAHGKDHTAVVLGHWERDKLVITDLMTYGQSFERMDLAAGTIHRIDPKDVFT